VIPGLNGKVGQANAGTSPGGREVGGAAEAGAGHRRQTGGGTDHWSCRQGSPRRRNQAAAEKSERIQTMIYGLLITRWVDLQKFLLSTFDDILAAGLWASL
jgi:hypothetical protein